MCNLSRKWSNFMNPGRKPVTNRAFSRRFTAGTPGEKLAFLHDRLERLIKGLQLFAGYCELAPSEFRSEVKQFVDLAEIELREGLKALQSSAQDASSPSASSDAIVQPTLQETLPTPASDENTDPTLVDTSSDPLLSAPNTNLDSLGMSFDSLAQMAQVPEANDLEAILARLQSYGEALDGGDVEKRKVGTQPSRDARELLLGFEVCRMDSDQSEVSLQPVAESQPSEVSGDWSNTKTFSSSSDATSLTTQYTEAVQFTPESAASNSLSYENSVADDLANLVSEVQGSDSVAAEETSEAHQSKPETGSGPQNNPNTARESKSEQSENSSPVNSIRPDNLLEINALKEELNSMLSQYKSAGPASSSS
jgi:hypothetical protein